MNAFTPLSFVRPTVLLVAFAYTLGAGLAPAWIGVSLVAWAELAWHARQLSKAAGWGRGFGLPYLACGLVGLFAWAAAPARVLAGLVTLFIWGAAVPVWMVNRQRWTEMRKARRAAIVEQVIDEAETMTLWARGTAALKVLRGARVAPADPTKAGAVNGRVINMNTRRPA
jgi:hypothetical protein